MRDNYDFSNAIRNPFAKKLKKQITIRIESETIDYFKFMSSKTGVPYQNLINLYLRDCASKKIEPSVVWG